jgi:hypothetical protein
MPDDADDSSPDQRLQLAKQVLDAIQEEDCFTQEEKEAVQSFIDAEEERAAEEREEGTTKTEEDRLLQKREEVLNQVLRNTKHPPRELMSVFRARHFELTTLKQL